MMKLSEELQYRGFMNQMTYKDLSDLDGDPITFYFGVDPSADSMTVGNLAAAMMVRHFIDNGHKAILLVGGATGMIGDPDGKKQERDLLSLENIARNKAAIGEQYRHIFAGKSFEVVDNYDWFKGINYLEFLRDVGKHVPMRQMLGRDFVQSRLGEDGAGISYAEFSYSLIQGYDFLHLFRTHGVTLQVCGADQWGNSITGVDLIRRITGKEAHVYSTPLVINKATGVKFGKSESGAVWLDPAKTTPTQFYQFWINCDDEGVEEYIKIYTLLSKDEIESVLTEQRANPAGRAAQRKLAEEVTRLVHGDAGLATAQHATDVMTLKIAVGDASITDETLAAIRAELPSVTTTETGSIISVLTDSGLASSNTEARRLLKDNAIAINDKKVQRETFESTDFINGRLLLRKGKISNTALVELEK